MSEPPSRFAAIVAQVVALREQLERMVYPGSGSPDYAVYEALYTIGTSIDEQHQALYPPGHDAECQLCFPLDVEEDEKEEEEEDTGDAVEEEEEDEEEDGGDEEEEDEKEEQAMDEDEDEDPEDLWDKQQTRRHRYDHPLLCGRSCCGVEPNDHKQSATCVCDYCLCIKPVPSISKSACTHRERHTEWLYCRAYAQEEEDHDPQTCYSTEHMCQQVGIALLPSARAKEG